MTTTIDTASLKPYLATAGPRPHLEAQAMPAPLWARLAAVHYNWFPGKRNGRVQKALRRWGSRRPPVFRVRLKGDIWWLVDLRHQPEYAIYHSAVAVEGADDHLVGALQGLVRPGDAVLDVGANRGYFTILLRRLVGSRGQVLAIEPVELTRSFLAANLRLNAIDDVLICPVGVSDAAGEAEISVNPKALGTSSLHCDQSDACPAGTLRQRIPLRRLDDVFTEAGWRAPDVIKIDVEGHELPAFRGALNLLRSQPLVFFEAWPEHAKATGFSPAAVSDLFQSCGPYRFSAIRWADGTLKHLPLPLRFEDFRSTAADLVAWVPEKHQSRIDRFASGHTTKPFGN